MKELNEGILFSEDIYWKQEVTTAILLKIHLLSNLLAVDNRIVYINFQLVSKPTRWISNIFASIRWKNIDELENELDRCIDRLIVVHLIIIQMCIILLR